MPVSGAIRVRILSTIRENVVMSNTFHLNVGGMTVNIGALEDIRDALNVNTSGECLYAYKQMLMTGDKIDEIRVSQVPLASDPHEAVLTTSAFPAQVGSLTNTAPNIPDEATATLTLQTGLTTRRARGRLFLPPPRLNSALNGENFFDTTAWWTGCQTWRTWLLKMVADDASRYTTGILSEATLAIYSRLQDLGSLSPVLYTVAGLRLNPKVHWLRSRAR